MSINNLHNTYKLNKKTNTLLSGNVLPENDVEYYNCVKDILENEVVLKMKNYIQHGNTTCYQHCINVSYHSYLLAKKLGLNTKSTSRAALLHDLFLYDWHTEHKTSKFFEKHGFTHPKTAFQNANSIFNLNEMEEDIIIKHMWPLTISLPKYKETAVVILMDKICCILEFMNYHFPLNFTELKKKYKIKN